MQPLCAAHLHLTLDEDRRPQGVCAIRNFFPPFRNPHFCYRHADYLRRRFLLVLVPERVRNACSARVPKPITSADLGGASHPSKLVHESLSQVGIALTMTGVIFFNRARGQHKRYAMVD